MVLLPMLGILLPLTVSRGVAYQVGDITVFNFTSSIAGGRLEMFLGDLGWSTFCSSGFDIRAANLSCHQLGYLHASRYGTVIELGYAKGSGYMEISLSCPADAFYVKSCTWSTTFMCDHNSDVAVICTNHRNEITTTTDQETRMTSYDYATPTSDTDIKKDEKSFVRVTVAMAFGLLAFLAGSLVIVIVSLILWKKKHGAQTEQDLLENDELNTTTRSGESNIYLPPPKYSEINTVPHQI